MFRDLIKKAYDLHFHIGPEVIPRKYTIPSLLIEEQGKIKGIAVKNHMFTTTFACNKYNNIGPKIIFSITLNNYLGGINPLQVEASAMVANDKIIVWFPTIHSSLHLSNNQYEIPSEWVHNTTFEARPSSDIIPVTILNNGAITKDCLSVLKIIKKYDAILATGHLSFEEVKILIETSRNIGIKRMIITHPIYHIQNFSIDEQCYLVGLGATLEMCAAMYFIDNIPIEDIVSQIQRIGSKNYIISSDAGQTFSYSPSETLNSFCNLLYTNGIKRNDIELMLQNSVRLAE